MSKRKMAYILNYLYVYVRERFFMLYIFVFKYSIFKTIKIKSHLTVEERLKLFEFAKQASFIAEIGSYVGASACCFSAALKQNDVGRVICIDTWNNDAMSEGERDTWKEFQINTYEYKEYIYPVRGYSTEVVETVRGYSNKLDLLFIDGDHSYECVKADWEGYKSFLREGSIIVFHDYGWAEGVKRVVQEDVFPIVNEFQQLPNMWWGRVGKLS